MKHVSAIIIALASLLAVWLEHNDRNEKQQLQWDYSSEIHRNTGAPPTTLGWK